MSHYPYQPNLLVKRARTSVTSVAGYVALFVAVSIGVAGLLSNRDTQTATIIDQLTTATPTADTSETPRPRDTYLGTAGVVALSRGLARDTVRWFDEGSGRAFEGNLRTRTVQTISDASIEGFQDAQWIPGAQQAIIVREDAQRGRVYELRDFQTQGTLPLEDGITTVVVSPDASRLAYVVPGPEASFIIKTATLDGSLPRIVLRTRLSISSLAWNGPDSLYLVTWRQADDRNDLLRLALDGTVTSLLQGREHIELRAASGAILVSYFDGTNVVATINPFTTTSIPVISSVSAHKCGWAANARSLVCGVADAPAASHGSSLSVSTDSITLVEASLGAGTPVSLHENDRVSVYTPVISSSGTFAAFINLFDRRIHVVEL